eukprot:m.345227 g.345227  ORF g.345227 m.345227 type:complete len:544 (+) comp25944_c0_seq1:173-1804(+)
MASASSLSCNSVDNRKRIGVQSTEITATPNSSKRRRTVSTYDKACDSNELIVPEQGRLGCLQVYAEAPNGEETLESLASICQKRLILLYKICGVPTDKIRVSQDVDGLTNKNDKTGHFFMRLAFASDKILSEWWLKAERKFFSARLSLLSSCVNVSESACAASLETILTILLHPTYKLSRVRDYDAAGRPLQNKIYEDEHVQRQELNRVVAKYGVFQEKLVKEDAQLLLAVPFEHCAKMIARRDSAVHLARGTAYLPRSHWGMVLETRFEAFMRKELDVARKMVPLILSGEDERLCVIVKHLQQHVKATIALESSTFSSMNIVDTVDDEELAPLQLNEISGLATYFPPCMRRIYSTLSTAFHVKHNGRLILTLFLKEAGLTLEEQHKFWEQHFLKGMTQQVYDSKRYKYNIRHLYGLEGSRINRRGFQCKNILNNYTSSCPFSNTEETMEEFNSLSNLSSSLKKVALDAVERKLGIRACGLHFQTKFANMIESCGGEPQKERQGDASRPDLPLGFESPEKYFEMARKLKKKSDKQLEASCGKP